MASPDNASRKAERRRACLSNLGVHILSTGDKFVVVDKEGKNIGLELPITKATLLMEPHKRPRLLVEFTLDQVGVNLELLPQ